MNKPLIKDVLSWDQFFNESSAEDSYPPKEIKLFNRLIAHTNKFELVERYEIKASFAYRML